MELGLNGRTVIVTGASGGIGRETARAFAAEGADVVLTYRTARSEAEVLAEDLGDRALVVQYDLAEPDAAQAVVDAAMEWKGRVDVLVNNAVVWGADQMAAAEFEAVPDDSWEPTLRANIEGTIRLSRAVTPILRERHWGRLVHLSSSLARDGAAGAEYYAAAKAALHGFSRSAAFSLGRDGDILSNVAMLGMIRTDTNGFITDAEGDHYAALAPIGRLLTAAEVARIIVFLASAANTGLTGQVIPIAGGS